MKQFLLLLFSLCLMGSSNAISNNSVVPKVDTEKKVLLPKKRFVGSITLSGGCKVQYDITIDYQIVPPRVNSIHGTVKMSGNCSGTQTFSAGADTDGKQIYNLKVDSKDPNLSSQEFADKLTAQINDEGL